MIASTTVGRAEWINKKFCKFRSSCMPSRHGNGNLDWVCDPPGQDSNSTTTSSTISPISPIVPSFPGSTGIGAAEAFGVGFGLLAIAGLGVLAVCSFYYLSIDPLGQPITIMFFRILNLFFKQCSLMTTYHSPNYFNVLLNVYPITSKLWTRLWGGLVVKS